MDAVTGQADSGESERLILDMVDKFLSVEVQPHVHALEHDDVYPAEIVEKMKAMGLFGCTIATEYGGLGLSTLTYAKIIERISAVWMSISGIVNSHLIMAMAVQRNGTVEQKERFLPTVRHRRTARRRRPHRAGLRDRPSGDTHGRPPRRR